MRLTEKSKTALLFGADMAMVYWETFSNRYPEKRSDMLVRLQELEIQESVELPESHAELRERFIEINESIRDELIEERCKLGGDGYALTFYCLAFALHITIVSMAFGEDVNVGSKLLSDALRDLGIHGEENDLLELLRLECEWIERTYEEVEDEAEVKEEDIFLAWSRMIHQLLERWQEAEKRRAFDLPEMNLRDVPLFSCFISYSHRDKEFCTLLYEKLRLYGVRVWYAEDTMIAGERIRDQIDRGLKTHDKTVLVLSEHSIKSDWVKYEMCTARAFARERGTNILLPVLLVNLENPHIRSWSVIDPITGEDLVQRIRSMLLPNFADWNNEMSFENSFQQLWRALRRLDVSDSRKNVGDDLCISGE